jgi:hypothetical protein
MIIIGCDDCADEAFKLHSPPFFFFVFFSPLYNSSSLSLLLQLYSQSFIYNIKDSKSFVVKTGPHPFYTSINNARHFASSLHYPACRRDRFCCGTHPLTGRVTGAQLTLGDSRSSQASSATICASSRMQMLMHGRKHGGSTLKSSPAYPYYSVSYG